MKWILKAAAVSVLSLLTLALSIFLDFAPIARNPLEFIMLANLFGYLAWPPLYLPGDIKFNEAWHKCPQMVVGQIAGMFGVLIVVVLVLLLKYAQTPPV